VIGLKSSLKYWTHACCVSTKGIQKPIVLKPISPLFGLQGFYSDFARVADDESRHLSWCLQRLNELGYAYGDMVAHSILWDGAQASSGESYALQTHAIPISRYAYLTSFPISRPKAAMVLHAMHLCVVEHGITMAGCAAR
jgi:hypothetical protein